MVVLAGGTYATLRDMADYGATLAFDDCENIMDAKRVDLTSGLSCSPGIAGAP